MDNCVHIAPKGNKKYYKATMLCGAKFAKNHDINWNEWNSYDQAPNEFDYCPQCVNIFHGNGKAKDPKLTEARAREIFREEIRAFFKKLGERT
jgi:hypothetical protein